MTLVNMQDWLSGDTIHEVATKLVQPGPCARPIHGAYMG